MAKQKPQRRPSKQEKPVTIDSVEIKEEDEDAVESAIEKMVKEYGPGIAAGIAIVVLVIAVSSYFITQSREANARKWWNLTQAVQSNRAEALQNVADENKGEFLASSAANKAAVLMIDDANLKYQTDPPAAKKLYKSAIEQLDDVIAAPATTDDLKKIAKLNKAGALEALGKISESTPIYKELAADDDFPFQEKAEAGVARSTNPIYTSFQEKIKDFNPSEKKDESAPGEIKDDMKLNLDEDKAPSKDDPTTNPGKAADPGKKETPTLADPGKGADSKKEGEKKKKEEAKSTLDLTGPAKTADTGKKEDKKTEKESEKKSGAEGSVGDKKESKSEEKKEDKKN